MNSRRVATKQILAKLSFSNLINLISSSKVIFTWFPFVFVLSVCLLGWVSLDSSWNLSLNERRTRNQINKLDWRTQIGFVWWRGWGFIYWDTIIIQVEIVWYHSWNCQRWVGPYEPLLIGSSQKKVLKLSTLTKIKSLQSQNRLKRSSAPVWATYMLWDKVRAIENILKEHIGNLTRPFLLLCLSSLSQFLGIYTCWNKTKKVWSHFASHKWGFFGIQIRFHFGYLTVGWFSICFLGETNNIGTQRLIPMWPTTHNRKHRVP